MRQHRAPHLRRGRLDQIEMLVAKRGFGDGRDLAIVHRIRNVVALRRGGEFHVELDIQNETLAELLLGLVHAMLGEQHEPRNFDFAVHQRALRIASATRSACTVSATSWTRTISAPARTASTLPAIEPPSRRSGGAGDTVSINRFRERPMSSF